MKLTKEQLEKLHGALMSAFPRFTDLARMVRYKLDENLDAIAGITGGGTLSEVIFNLIVWAESAGRMEELFQGACKEQPRNLDLKRFGAEMRWGPSLAPVDTLGTPLPGKAGILIDLSHDQSEWDYHQTSIFRAAQGNLAPILRPSPQESPWDLKEIKDRELLNAEVLKAWSGLLMGMPYHQRIEDATRYEIVKWVRSGGRLVLLGYELGERHHETNLNSLAGEFGLRFNSDIIGPANWRPPSRPYGVSIDFDHVQSAHPCMKGVVRLQLRNLCTLTVEPGTDILLLVGNNHVVWPKKDKARYTSKGWLPLILDCEGVSGAKWVPAIAEAPADLTGAGKVLAIGTWQLFELGYVFPSGFDNLTFVANLFEWLGSKS